MAITADLEKFKIHIRSALKSSELLRVLLRKVNLIFLFRDPRLRWQSQLGKEVDFWKQFIGDEEWALHDEFLARLDPDRPMQELIAKYLDAGSTTTARILDVGADPRHDWVKKLVASPSIS